MQRIINLTGRLALEWADWQKALNGAGESTEAFEKRVAASEKRMEKSLDSLYKKRDRLSKDESKQKDQRLKEEQDFQEKRVKLEKQAEERIAINKQKKDVLKAKISEIKEAETVQNRFNHRISELNRQLSDDYINQIRTSSDKRIKEAQKEKSHLLRLAKQQTKELTDEEKERVASLVKIRNQYTRTATEKRKELNLRQSAFSQGETDLLTLARAVGQDPSNSAIQKQLIDATLAQNKRKDAIARTQSSIATLTSNRTDVDKQILNIKASPEVGARVAALDRIIGEATESIIEKHIASVQDTQKKVAAQLQAEKDRYIRRNQTKLDNLQKDLNAIPSKSDESDALKEEIKKLKDNLKKYLSKKDAEIQAVNDEIVKADQEINRLRSSPEKIERKENILSPEQKYNAFANRAQARDSVATSIFNNTAIATAGIIGVIRQGLPVQAAFRKELASTSVAVSDYAKIMDIQKKAMLASGKGAEEVASGYRKIENILGQSQTIPVFNAALKQSITTYSDFSAAAETAAKIHSIFGINVGKASNVVNTMTHAANLSQLEVDDLSKVMGQTAGLAKAVGLNFVETTAALTLFTKKGLSAHESATQLRNSISKIFSPTEKVKNVLREFSRDSGVDLVKAFSSTSLRADGLAGAFSKIREAADKLGLKAEDLAIKLFPNLRGTIAGTILASNDGFKSFTNIVSQLNETFKDGRDFLGEKYKVALDDVKVQTDRLSVASSLAASTIADSFAPQIKTMANFLGSLSGNLGSATRESKNFFSTLATSTVVFALTTSLVYKAGSAIDSFRAASIAAGGGLQFLGRSLGAIAVATVAITGITYVINKYTEAQKSELQVFLEGNEARKTNISTTIETARANFDALSSVTPLIARYRELKKSEGESKKESDERKKILEEIYRLAPELIESNKRYAGSLDLIKDADKRLRKSILETQAVQFAGVRNREQQSIKEAELKLKEAQQRESYVKALLNNPAFPRDAESNIFGGFASLGYTKKLFPEVNFSNIELAGSKSLQEYIRKKLSPEQKIKEVTQEVISQRRALELMKEEFSKKEKVLLGLKNQVDKPVAESVKPQGEGVLPFDMETYFGQVTDRLKEESALVRNKRSELTSLISETERLFKESYIAKNGDTQANKVKGDNEFEAYKKKNGLSELVGVVGSDVEKANALTAAIAKARKNALALATELDGLREANARSETKKTVLEGYISERDKLSDILELDKGRQRTFLQRALSWLNEVVYRSPDKKVTATRGTFLTTEEIFAYTNDAKKADLKQVTDKIKKQGIELEQLMSEMNPDKVEKNVDRLEVFFKKNVELSRVLNQGASAFLNIFGIKTSGNIVTDTLAKNQRDIDAFRKVNKLYEELFNEINKRQADLTAPKNDEDRITTDLTGGMYNSVEKLRVALGEKAPVIIEGIKKLAEATKVKTDNPFKNLDDDIKKAEGALSDLIKIKGDQSFADFVLQKGGSSKPSADEEEKLKTLFAIEKTSAQIVKIKEKLDSLRKKAKDDPIGDIPLAGQRLSQLQKELDLLERYESRMKAIESTFKSVFTRAFDRLLLEKGNFFQSLSEGVKEGALRLASQQLSAGLFDITQKAIGDRFKPKNSKNTQDILNNPESFLKKMRDELFNANNVMSVRIVADNTVGAKAPIVIEKPSQPTTTTTTTTTGSSTSGDKTTRSTATDYLKGSAEAYAFSKSKTGSQVAGTGLVLSQLAKDRNVAKILGASSSKSLLGLAGTLGQVGLGLAINDALGNPIGKVEKFFRRNIFGRATTGVVPAGSTVYSMNEPGTRDEVFVPTTNGIIENRSNKEVSGAPVQVNFSGPVRFSNDVEVQDVVTKIATNLSTSRYRTRRS